MPSKMKTKVLIFMAILFLKQASSMLFNAKGLVQKQKPFARTFSICHQIIAHSCLEPKVKHKDGVLAKMCIFLLSRTIASEVSKPVTVMDVVRFGMSFKDFVHVCKVTT